MPVHLHALAVFVELGFVRLLVHAVDGRRGGHAEEPGHGLVGCEHAFFDQLVGNVVFDPLEARGVPLLVEPDFHLGEVEVERAFLEALFAQDGRHGPRLVQHGVELVGRFGLQADEGFLVGEAARAADDTFGEARLADFAVTRNFQEGGKGETVFVRTQAAEPVAQRFGQHGDDAVGQINAVPPLVGLLVERGGRNDIVRDVGHVDSQLPAVLGFFYIDRIVEVPGIVRIDGHDQRAAAILAPLRGGLRDGVGERLRRGQDVFGKLGRQVELADDRLDVDAGFVRGPENFDNFAFRIGMPGGPFAEFDHDLVALVRTQRGGGLGDVDVVDEIFVVGHDMPEAVRFLERADGHGGAAFEDADDAAAGLIPAVRWLVAQMADDHAVAGQGGRGVFRGEIKFRIARFVAQEVGRPIAMGLHRADHEVSFLRESETVLAHAHDVAGDFQIMKNARHGGCIFAAGLEDLGDFLERRRGLAVLAHEFEHAGGQLGIGKTGGGEDRTGGRRGVFRLFPRGLWFGAAWAGCRFRAGGGPAIFGSGPAAGSWHVGTKHLPSWLAVQDDCRGRAPELLFCSAAGHGGGYKVPRCLFRCHGSNPRSSSRWPHRSSGYSNSGSRPGRWSCTPGICSSGRRPAIGWRSSR